VGTADTEMTAEAMQQQQQQQNVDPAVAYVYMDTIITRLRDLTC
jgi:hypothetical protein